MFIAHTSNELGVQLPEKTNEVQRFIPSHLKHVSTLNVKTNGFLKIRRRTLFITSREASSNSKGKVEEEE